MNRDRSKYLTLGALLSLIHATSATAAVEMRGATLSHDVGAGAQLSDVSGDREKFEEYREVSDGFFLDDLRLRVDSTTTPSFFDLDVQNALQSDESYRLTFGRHGHVRATLFYDVTPHNFSKGLFLWNGVGTARLVVSDFLQSQLEGREQTAAERTGVSPVTGGALGTVDPNFDRTGEDAARQAIIRDLYGSSADIVRLRLRRSTTGGAVEYDLTRNSAVWLRVANENREGARILGAGTYERWPTCNTPTGACPTPVGTTHVADRFVVVGQDLAEPLNYRTLSVTGGAGVHGKSWLGELEYTFTSFRNFYDRLIWDNQFRLTDAIQGPGGSDRGRFALGQIALPPDSQSHDVNASAAVDLPMHGRLAASLGFGMITQDEPFVPYTLNTAIRATNVPGTPFAATLALPQRDLNGETRTVSAALQATVRPLERVGVTAKYGLYWYDGRSDEITFPGYAAFGESDWRIVKNDVQPQTGPNAGPVRNEVFDFVRHSADLGFDIKVARPLTVALEAGWEFINFTQLRIEDLTETFVGGAVSYRPVRIAHLSASYRVANRKTAPYITGRTPGNPEATGLVNFNWAERKRHEADARLRLTPVRFLSFGASVKAVDEDYDGTFQTKRIVDEFRFGRSHVESLVAALDVTVTPADRVSFNAYYARDYRQEQMKNAAKDDNAKGTPFFGIPDDYSPVNYWNSDMYDRGHTVGLGATIGVIPERLIVDAGYNFSWSELEFVNFNPAVPPPAGGPTPPGLANAIAQPWSPVRNRLHEIIGDVGYKVTPNVRAGVRYLFEWYELDDFTWDLLDPYMAGRTPENSTRFLFADATYRRYDAHVGRVYLQGSF